MNADLRKSAFICGGFPISECAFNNEVVYNSRALTLTQLTLTSMSISSFQNRDATLKRWLGLLLVLFIFYGTSVEAAHCHGRISPPSNRASAVIVPDAGSSLFNTKPGCNDCLICQLHQNFSSTLISFKLNAEPLISSTPATTTVSVFISSISHTPQSGRAPPQAN